jgi:hypothetical protein
VTTSGTTTTITVGQVNFVAMPLVTKGLPPLKR